MKDETRKILGENIGRPVNVRGFSPGRFAVKTEFDHFNGGKSWAYLLDNVEQERGNSNFIFVYPFEFRDSEIAFIYGLIVGDKIDSAREKIDHSVHGYQVIDIFPERDAVVRDWAGGLYLRKDIERFKHSVSKYYPNAPFLKQKPLTLLVEGVHV